MLTDKIFTYQHTDTHIHTLQSHTVQWLYFRFVEEVELNESYPEVRFPGTGLTSSNPPPPLPPGLSLSPPQPLHLVPIAAGPCHPELPTVNVQQPTTTHEPDHLTDSAAAFRWF